VVRSNVIYRSRDKGHRAPKKTCLKLGPNRSRTGDFGMNGYGKAAILHSTTELPARRRLCKVEQMLGKYNDLGKSDHEALASSSGYGDV
jgi:hypothetical protein